MIERVTGESLNWSKRALMLAVLAILPVQLFGSVEVPSITYFGGAEGVSGSLALLETGDAEILIDCGVFMDETFEREGDFLTAAYWRNVELPAKVIGADAVLITHAHADHLGRLPLLVRSGFSGPIYMTEGTAELAERMFEMGLRWEEHRHRDWVWTVNNEGREYLTVHWAGCRFQGMIGARNRRSLSGTIEALEARLTRMRAERLNPCRGCAGLETGEVMDLVRLLEFGDRTEIFPGVRAEMIPNGHIPGSAAIFVEVEREGESFRVLFSGDVGARGSTLVSDPAVAPEVDLVFIETTYGAVVRQGDGDEERAEFREKVASALREDRIVWIPAFALDRTQKMLYELQLLREEQPELMDGVPVHVLSPSANGFTEIYRRNFDRRWFREGLERDFLEQEVETSMDAKIDEGPAVLITTSGMMDAVYSRELIPRLGTRDDVEIFFVGYTAEGTEGRQIRDRGEVEVDDLTISVTAKVHSFGAFSGHGDAADMDDWISVHDRNTPIGLVHGDSDALEARLEDLQEKGWENAFIVRLGERIPIIHSESQ